jgi:hypothetical protein
MHEHERDCALGKQPDFAGQLGRQTDAGFCQPVSKLGLEHGFVPARNQTRRVAGKIGKLDHQAREPVLSLQHGGQQRVFAGEVIVEVRLVSLAALAI